MAIQDDITLIVIVANIILTAVLVYIYSKNYKAISSKYTLGLLFFSVAFLVENILDFYFYSSLLGQSITGVTTFHATVNILEMVGLILILYVTSK